MSGGGANCHPKEMNTFGGINQPTRPLLSARIARTCC